LRNNLYEKLKVIASLKLLLQHQQALTIIIQINISLHVAEIIGHKDNSVNIWSLVSMDLEL
jgi:hypothetical protein